MMLEQSTRDFQSLIDRMQIQRAFENAKDGNRWVVWLCTFELRHEKTIILVSNQVGTNQAAQLQKMARGLKFRI